MIDLRGQLQATHWDFPFFAGVRDDLRFLALKRRVLTTTFKAP